MDTIIRQDFHPIPWQLQRLLEYSKTFDGYNIHEWSHLKNNEDFSDILLLEWDVKQDLERIYMVGRDLAVSMAYNLTCFNTPTICPTLNDFLNLNAFSNEGWIGQIEDLEEISNKAKMRVYQLEKSPWAIREMIKLYDTQIKLLYEVRNCLTGLKRSELFLREQNIENGNIYNEILKTINNIGKRFESLPRAYSQKDEETLRDDILISLQSIPELATFGEVFNKKGKTDILAYKDSNIEFIGECKFWYGARGFNETIEQLLTYLTWRNNKAAIIIFVKNKNIQSVIDSMLNTIKKHPNYIEQILPENDKTWFNFKFSHINSVIDLAIMLYHIPEN
ncbi:MAG: hypothetical protein E7E20_04670 [Haemophilus parainfluenzae]|mgnify:FL=1|jgi:hypothetical protein|nr:hypothetical protein [Haemophilus parainfluenzae]